MTKNTRGLLITVIIGLMFGSNMVVSRFSIDQFAPITFASMRFLLASVTYLIFFAVVKSRRFPTELRLWRKALIYGVINSVIPMISFLTALKYFSSGITSLFNTLTPVLIILLAHFFLEDERLNLYKVIGVLVALSGAGLLLVSGETGIPDFSQADPRGYLWMGIAIISISISSIFARKYLKDEDDISITGAQTIVAAILCIPIALLTDGYDISAVNLSGWIAFVYISIIGTFVVFLFNFYHLKRYGATVNSQISYVIPVAATTLGVIFLEEQVTLILFVSMVLVFLGLTILNRGNGKDNV